MGLGKNISNLFGKAKSVLKAPAKSAIKSADSNTIKTTSKVLGSGATEISGGRAVMKNLAQSTGTAITGTARVGAKVFPYAAVIGGTSLGATKIYNYVADEWAMTNAQREYENQIRLSNDETAALKKAQDQQIKYIIDLNNARNQAGDSAVMGGSGGAGDFSLFPIGDKAAADSAAEQGSKNIMWYVIGGIAVIGAGTYIYSKNRKVKK
jgi:hypothetical protein